MIDHRAGGTEVRHLLASLVTMAWFVEARDPYTGGHLWRVSRYATLLAEAAGGSGTEAALAGLGGLLHDIGKIGIPDQVLRKPGPLTPDEQATIRTHPIIGHRMLSGHPLASWVSPVILMHHERPDGRGYPRGLEESEVPFLARVVAVADTFDAITSSRTFRPSRPMALALEELAKAADTQLDTGLVQHLVTLARAGVFDDIVAHSDHGIPLSHCPACGPTVVIRRDQRPGDPVFCRNCGHGFRIEQSAGGPVATPTESRATAEELAPVADEALIAKLVGETAEALLPAQLERELATPLPSRGALR